MRPAQAETPVADAVVDAVGIEVVLSRPEADIVDSVDNLEGGVAAEAARADYVAAFVPEGVHSHARGQISRLLGDALHARYSDSGSGGGCFSGEVSSTVQTRSLTVAVGDAGRRPEVCRMRVRR